MPNTLCFFSMNPGLSTTQPTCPSLLALHTGIPPLMTGDNLLSLPIFFPTPPPPPLQSLSPLPPSLPPPSCSLVHRLPWDIAPRAPVNKCKHTGPRGSPASANTRPYTNIQIYKCTPSSTNTRARTVRREPPERSCYDIWNHARAFGLWRLCLLPFRGWNKPPHLTS